MNDDVDVGTQSIQKLTIVDYDPEWPRAFAAERDRIAEVLGSLALRIDHHGSTSVPGLAAKPVIDIQVSVAALHPLQIFLVSLNTIGYVHVPHPDDAVCPFLHRPAAWPHTHHVHLVQHGGREEARTLAFRDYLRDHIDAARAYAHLKRRLASQHSGATFHSRQAYAEAKSAFVTTLTDGAVAAGYPR